MAKKGGKLTAQQKLFIEYHCLLRNGTRAAREAGYGSPARTAWELLNKPQYKHVQEALAVRRADVFSELRAKRNDFMDRCWQIIQFDVSTVFESDGTTMKDFSEIDPEDRRCLAGLTIKKFKGGATCTVRALNPSPFAKIWAQASGLTTVQADDQELQESEINDELTEKLKELEDKLLPEDDQAETGDEDPDDQVEDDELADYLDAEEAEPEE